MEKDKDKTPEKESEGKKLPINVFADTLCRHFFPDEAILDNIKKIFSYPSSFPVGAPLFIEIRPETEGEANDLSEEKEALFRKREALLSKMPPPTFKQGREASLQLSKIERDLFTDIEEQESGNYIVSGLPKRISELDFTAFTFAVGQILYNQSFLFGNADVNSGVEREEATGITKATGITQYVGVIQTTLKEICLKGYGAATTELRRRMELVINFLDGTRIKIKYPNGDVRKSFLCCICDEFRRAKDGAVEYVLSLNPIFGYRIQNSYGELPQDIIQRLDDTCKRKKRRKQAAHYLLLRWLCVQDKRYPHTLTIGKLLEELRMEGYYRENARKAEKQLLSVCDTMRDVGILESYEEMYSSIRNKKRISKVTFHLKKDFLRTLSKKLSNP